MIPSQCSLLFCLSPEAHNWNELQTFNQLLSTQLFLIQFLGWAIFTPHYSTAGVTSVPVLNLTLFLIHQTKIHANHIQLSTWSSSTRNSYTFKLAQRHSYQYHTHTVRTHRRPCNRMAPKGAGLGLLELCQRNKQREWSKYHHLTTLGWLTGALELGSTHFQYCV